MFTKADKAIAGGVGGALAILVNWTLINFANLEMGVDELSALALVIGAVISAVLVYFVPNKS